MTAAFIATDQIDARLRSSTPAGDEARAVLDRLWARGRDFLGTELAIMGGAMTWVSERTLVAAISNAGGFGVIASGSMSPDLLSAEIAATAALTHRPFGVNLITMHPRLFELIEVCLEHRVVTSCSLAASRPGRRLREFAMAARARCVLRPPWCWPRS